MKQVIWDAPIVRSKESSYHYGIVYDIRGRGIKVLLPDNTIKVGLTDYWEVINTHG